MTRETAAQLLARLAPRERQILRERFGIGGPEHTLCELGERHGLSREGVRYVERTALARLRAIVTR